MRYKFEEGTLFKLHVDSIGVPAGNRILTLLQDVDVDNGSQAVLVKYIVPHTEPFGDSKRFYVEAKRISPL